MIKVLFVCLGNICRSPTAHAVFRQMAQLQKLPVEVESAGTSAYHQGAAPDNRSLAVGKERGYNFSGIRSRPVKDADFAYYDFIFAMDLQNLADLQRRCPEQYQHKLQLFLHRHPDFAQCKEVPDPYYGGSRGFERVLDLIEQGSKALLAEMAPRQR
ncbi:MULTISPECIES: low molecular weight protein-tyrosine-phosphatase [Alkalimonas]|uniref:protein-tyrosine-phosphatase n=1 Tax=Alkalimonas mucilaginosa TaxID=3057676 RepID=A0ABU7JDT4_9GAMM|nr:low molecular weight protein-tyrosine-phosphatase [Alkalimonas sp. MEB004]MEE2023645.1 low molecular weight protein-tyrosine-phosphatase [Alkalimonas sp. MEB004]